MLVVGLFSFAGSLNFVLDAEEEIRDFCARRHELSLVAAFLLYTSLSAMPIPVAAIASIICGWLFGLYWGVPLVCLASNSGATITFLASRYSIRHWVEHRFASVLKSIDDAIVRDGSFYVVLLRLLPGIPFFVVNACLGVTRLTTMNFFVLSFIGMLPGTIAFVYFGSQLPTLRALQENGMRGIMTWQLNLTLIGLVLVPWMIRLLVRNST